MVHHSEPDGASWQVSQIFAKCLDPGNVESTSLGQMLIMMIYHRVHRERREQFLAAIAADPNATFSTLETSRQIPRKTLQRIAAKARWKKGNGTAWSKLSDGETEESAVA